MGGVCERARHQRHGRLDVGASSTAIVKRCAKLVWPPRDAVVKAQEAVDVAMGDDRRLREYCAQHFDTFAGGNAKALRAFEASVH